MKPRNHVVLALIKSSRKQGAHVKSKKAIRRKDNMDVKMLLQKDQKEKSD